MSYAISLVIASSFPTMMIFVGIERSHEWYKDVNACTLRVIKAARECIRSRENEVLNYFINRSTNASAESLNSKLKGFKAQLHGIADIPFFMYRICTIFG